MARGYAKKKKKGKKGKKKEIPMDPRIVGMELPDLKELVEEQDSSLLNSRKDRNYYQLERDKINDFWQITQNSLNNIRNELRIKDREIEGTEERHQIELKVYKQKVRHLLYEQKITMDRLKIENDTKLKEHSDNFDKQCGDLRKEKRQLKRQLKEELKVHDEKTMDMNNQHQKMMRALKREYSDRLQSIINNYEQKISTLKENMDLRAQKETAEMEERKNTHIQKLVNKHKQSFSDIKEYYKKITTDNLKMIKTLQKDLETMQKNELNNETLMFEIAQENKKLSEPLEVVKDEVKHLRQQLNTYEKDKLSLKNATSRLFVLQDELKATQGEYQVLEDKFQQVEDECNDLYNKFETTIDEVQQKTLGKNQLLEEEVNRLRDQMLQKDVRLREAIKAADLDPMMLQQFDLQYVQG
mmetsp:Transcript_8635/g.12750  ORF Transcript_8635/g.12750 Transcript_8635/m.12750 type:complete len:413 (+) Transcript_8635:41-1279(+)